jgi:hypothetical protein
MMCIPMAAFLALALLPQATAATSTPAPAPGTIAVEVADDAPQSERLFTDAVTVALSDAHFVPLPLQSHSRYVARVKVTRTARGLGRADAKEAGPMAALGQVYVTLPSGKSQIRGLVGTDLEVEILLRSDQTRVWSGRASTVQMEGGPADTPAAIATKLASALMRRFPAGSGEAVSVP